MNRLNSVDGWRAIAVLGVIWWHAWIHAGNPALTLGGFNCERILAPLGNGVDLFFVISGFCIRLALQRIDVLSPRAYAGFLGRRWLRLTPVFYTVCAVTAAVLWSRGQRPTETDLLAHATWLLQYWPGAHLLAPPFWSLAVEWEFYLIAPLVLYAGTFLHPRICLTVAVFICLAWRYTISAVPSGIAVSGYDQLPAHLLAFTGGIVVADGWLHNAPWLQSLQRPSMLMIGGVIAYVGRGLMSTDVFQLIGRAGVAAKTIGEPVMTTGFSVMLASTLGENHFTARALARPPFRFLGRLSYGLYLWHWWPCLWVGHYLRSKWGPTVPVHYVTLAATLVVAVPLAWLTYRCCEQPYFLGTRRHHPTATPLQA